MTKQDIERAIERLWDEAKHQYRQGNIKAGRKAERQARDLEKILKAYE